MLLLRLLLPLRATVRSLGHVEVAAAVPEVEFIELPFEKVTLVLKSDADLGRHLVGVAANVEPVGEAAQGLL